MGRIAKISILQTIALLLLFNVSAEAQPLSFSGVTLFPDPQTEFLTGSRAACADLDNDGDLDIVVSGSDGVPNYSDPQFGFFVYLQDSNGNFVPVSAFNTFGVTPTVFAVEVADLFGPDPDPNDSNNINPPDGKPDVVMLSGGTGPSDPAPNLPVFIDFFMGLGNGAFQPMGDWRGTSLSAVDLKIADMDSDGDLDLVVLQPQRRAFILKGAVNFEEDSNGDVRAVFGATQTLQVFGNTNGNESSHNLVVAEIDRTVGENSIPLGLDVLFGVADPNSINFGPIAALWRSTGTSFGSVELSSLFDDQTELHSVFGITVGEFTHYEPSQGEGKDIAAIIAREDTTTVELLSILPGGTSGAPGSVDTVYPMNGAADDLRFYLESAPFEIVSARSIEAGDLDNDGLDELVIGGEQSLDILVIVDPYALGDEDELDMPFEHIQLELDNAVDIIWNILIEDINGDGWNDIIVPTGGDVQIFLNSTASLFSADLNDDGLVNGTDLAILFTNWGDPGGPADLNNDGIVNGTDLAIVLAHWT